MSPHKNTKAFLKRAGHSFFEPLIDPGGSSYVTCGCLGVAYPSQSGLPLPSLATDTRLMMAIGENFPSEDEELLHLHASNLT